MSLVLTLVFFLLLALSVPVAHTLLIASGAALWADGALPLLLVVQQMFAQTQSFPLLALPFFILAGELMMSGRLGQGLIAFASATVGHVRGGLAATTVVGSVVFGGVSGSAVSDASALGSVLIPWQTREGYPAGFAAANNAAAATIAILIPPSIPMILYALVSNVSVGALFLAGVLPGLMLAAGFLAVCSLSARLRGFPVSDRSAAREGFGSLLLAALPAIAMPVLILASLRFGVATPTEVSVMAVLYALAVATLVYRDMTLRRFLNALVNAGRATGVVMLVIMASAAVGWIMTFVQAPQAFAAWATGTLSKPWLIVLAMNGIMLVAGMFIDLPAAILLLGPIFVPLAQSIGLDLVQLGVMMVLNLAIGLYTPPVGTTLFISTTIARVPILATSLELLPFYVVGLTVLLLFSFVPALTLRF
ncbi:TRAP transporter large permease subunit [Elioraea tepida]|uniref:TRAP transporter large permease protein n=1 Tax=Elioraea tepida TaxID=2843330 RepID=A0A975U3K6_9PROT|nr:TRAP transporter large permease subunit [Elioraea tepida]QXM25664.1 TRAP transporter large permease subunit [Elioraea tepida]